MIDWQAARFDYISNHAMTLAEIAEKYQAAPATVWRRSGREGWKEQRKAASEKLIEKVREKVVYSESEQVAACNQRHLALAQKLETAVVERLEPASELSENAQSGCGE